MYKINRRFFWLFVVLGLVGLAQTSHALEHANSHEHKQSCLVCDLGSQASLPDPQVDFFFPAFEVVYPKTTLQTTIVLFARPVARGPPTHS